MFQILIYSDLNFSLVNVYLGLNFFSEMGYKKFLLFLAHGRFYKGQNNEKIGPCAFQTSKLILKCGFELKAIVFEHPSPGHRDKLFMGVICASFEFL